jgi:hypothetical protein
MLDVMFQISYKYSALDAKPLHENRGDRKLIYVRTESGSETLRHTVTLRITGVNFKKLHGRSIPLEVHSC